MVDIVKGVFVTGKKMKCVQKRQVWQKKSLIAPSQTVSHTLFLTNHNNHFVIIEAGGK